MSYSDPLNVDRVRNRKGRLLFVLNEAYKDKKIEGHGLEDGMHPFIRKTNPEGGAEWTDVNGRHVLEKAQDTFDFRHALRQAGYPSLQPGTEFMLLSPKLLNIILMVYVKDGIGSISFTVVDFEANQARINHAVKTYDPESIYTKEPVRVPPLLVSYPDMEPL